MHGTGSLLIEGRPQGSVVICATLLPFAKTYMCDELGGSEWSVHRQDTGQAWAESIGPLGASVNRSAKIPVLERRNVGPREVRCLQQRTLEQADRGIHRVPSGLPGPGGIGFRPLAQSECGGRHHGSRCLSTIEYDPSGVGYCDRPVATLNDRTRDVPSYR